MKKNKELHSFSVHLLGRVIRAIVSIRYKAQIKNEHLAQDRSSPILFLSAHQALMDPPTTISHILRYNKISPIVLEDYYHMPGVHSLIKRINGIPVSNVRGGNRDPKVFDKIAEGVKKAFASNNNVILYPSGEISFSSLQRIGNRRSAYLIAQNLPENVKIIGIRMRGYWGSRWSTALSGKIPNFLWCLIRSIGYTFANLIFFVPKRTINLEFEDITERVRTKALEDKATFNKDLEAFFNEIGEDEFLFETPLFFLPPSWRKRNRTPVTRR